MRRSLLTAAVTALAVCGTAVAASFVPGTYAGITDQHGPFKMVVTKSTMKSAQYGPVYACKDKNGNSTGNSTQTTKLNSTSIKNGHIDHIFRLYGGSDFVHLVATLKGKKITGYFREAYGTTGGGICVTHSNVNAGNDVSFTLKPKR